jgi:hypothetical protein
MNKENPCDICQAKCDGCFWYMRYNKRYYCDKYECMYNFEDSCTLDIYDGCNCLTGVRAESDD